MRMSNSEFSPIFFLYGDPNNNSPVPVTQQFNIDYECQTIQNIDSELAKDLSVVPTNIGSKILLGLYLVAQKDKYSYLMG